MKFSLTTSFYNGENFVEKLYENTLSQTYKNWEWIVTDDFSSDNTKKILLSICDRDKRVKYVEQSFKKEMFWNPQKFCKETEIVVQLDSDDLMMPKALEIYNHFFTKFPNVILIVCNATKFLNNHWNNIIGIESTLCPNLSYGYQTFLRAWRNRFGSNLEFNPGNWMKYFYNDLSIVTTLEELGDVLVLPRMLYHYTVREDSISNKKQDDVFDLKKENEVLISNIKNRRQNVDLDTLERYFDPIYHISKGISDYNLNNISGSLKISFYKNNLSFHEKKLMRELYYDLDINFNNLQFNSDYNIFFISDENDVKFLIDNLYDICDKSSGKTQIIIEGFNEKSDDFKNSIHNLLLARYNFEYFITNTENPNYEIINILKY